jgi:hypothetical protein
MTKYPDSLDNDMARLEREFTTEEQGLFLQLLLPQSRSTDFVIDLDDV